MIGVQSDSQLTQQVSSSQIFLLFVFANKSTHVAVLHNALEVKKQTNKRNKSADTWMSEFETAPLQGHKQEGNKNVCRYIASMNAVLLDEMTVMLKSWLV